MGIKDRHIRIYQKPVTENYIILDEKLCIKDVYIEKYDLFKLPSTVMKGKHITEVLKENYLPLYKQIHSEFQPDIPSAFDVSVNAHLELEIKVYPSCHQIIIVLKDKTKSTHIDQILKETNHKTSFLTGISNDILISEEPKQLLTSLFNRISDYLDLDVYFNYILDEKKQKLRLMNYQGISESTANEIEWLELGEAVCGTVARDQARIVAEDIAASSDPKVQLIQRLGIKSYICHPLFSNENILGTLSFGSSKREKFTTEEIEIIEQVCEQVAISLERQFLISKLKEKNEALEYSNHKLIQANEKSEQGNKAKTEFLLLMSHEFRTPLNVINGFIQMLLFDLENPLSIEQKKRLKKMRRATKQLQSMINDILHVVRYEIGELHLNFTHFNVNDVITECINTLQPIAERRKISVYFHKEESNASIYSDTKRIEQIIINLISNALKYNTQGGEVFVKSVIDNKNLIIEVKDTGKGISKEELPLIFTPFYRSPSNYTSIEGTGIGLTLVRQILDKMGGNIRVTSHIGKGVSFVVKIPIET